LEIKTETKEKTKSKTSARGPNVPGTADGLTTFPAFDLERAASI
jgi:hypothetical protein